MTNHAGANPIHDADTRSVTDLGAVRSREEIIATATEPPALSGTALPTHPDVGPPPDGGLEAWLCILGGMLQMFCVFGFCECLTEFC